MKKCRKIEYVDLYDDNDKFAGRFEKKHEWGMTEPFFIKLYYPGYGVCAKNLEAKFALLFYILFNGDTNNHIILDGYSMKGMVSELNLSETTVKNYIYFYLKWGCLKRVYRGHYLINPNLCLKVPYFKASNIFKKWNEI